MGNSDPTVRKRPRALRERKRAAALAAMPKWPPEHVRPNWARWARAPAVLLEEAVALSLNAEPLWYQRIVNPDDDVPPIPPPGRHAQIEFIKGDGYNRVQWYHPAHASEDGRRRLGLLRERHGTGDLPAGKSTDGKPRVRLGDVARFAKALGWNDIPEPLARLGGRTLTRKALIAEFEPVWRLIEGDLSDAGDNGLKDAAAAGRHGYWLVEPALAWASERGKIASRTELPSWPPPKKGR